MGKTNVKRIDVPLPGPVAAERREGKRSEPTAAPAATGGVPVWEAEGPRPARPEPEVAAKAARRHFNAEYKQRILREVDRCRDEGAIGALLRREGLYSSHLTTWRRQRDQAVQAALAPHKRGPKPARNPLVEEMEKLRRENARLAQQLEKAEIIIDVQKKVSSLLGISLKDSSNSGENNS
jgi:transposase-like protein